MSFSIDVVVMIDDNHHLMGGGGGPFIKELHDSHVGLLAMTAMAPQICTYHKQKTSA